MDTIYTENGNTTEIYRYVFSGHGQDAQSIWAEFRTTFSIADGLISEHEFTRRVDECGATYEGMTRTLPGLTY